MIEFDYFVSCASGAKARAGFAAYGTTKVVP